MIENGQIFPGVPCRMETAPDGHVVKWLPDAPPLIVEGDPK